MIKVIDNSEAAIPCPLCRSIQIHVFHQDARRDYWRCQRCLLVFVSADQRLSSVQEKAQYDLHNNDPCDAGYRTFLARLVQPLQQRLKPNMTGLDYGCGPGPALSLMMAESGWSVRNYDIFYDDDKSLLAMPYDFITATEVLEHVFEPSVVLPLLWGLLAKGGYLALMTKLVIDEQAFARWHYKNDLTHVCFYSKPTFEYIAKELSASLEFIDKDVIFLQK